MWEPKYDVVFGVLSVVMAVMFVIAGLIYVNKKRKDMLPRDSSQKAFFYVIVFVAGIVLIQTILQFLFAFIFDQFPTEYR